MKRIKIPALIGLSFAGALALTPATLVAQDTVPGASQAAEANPAKALPNPAVPAAGQWQFRTDPILWFAAIHGDATVRGHQADVNVSFDQIANHLEGPPLMAYLEARQDKFGFFLQPIYMKLRGDANVGPLSGSDTLALWDIQGGGFYQLVNWGEEKPLTIDVIAGARYWNLYNNITLHGPHDILVFTGSKTIILTDAIFGLRGAKYLTDKLSVNLAGNAGGFGWSSSTSDFSWQATGLLGYDFTRRFSLYAGYNALGVEKHTGSGSSENGANLVLSGVLVALDFRW